MNSLMRRLWQCLLGADKDITAVRKMQKTTHLTFLPSPSVYVIYLADTHSVIHLKAHKTAWSNRWTDIMLYGVLTMLAEVPSGKVHTEPIMKGICRLSPEAHQYSPSFPS